jgi:hypothetical protein
MLWFAVNDDRVIVITQFLSAVPNLLYEWACGIVLLNFYSLIKQ